MKEKLSQIAENFNGRNIRERGLITVSILAVIYLLWDFAFYAGLMQETNAVNAREKQAQQDMLILTSEQKVLVKALTADPAAPKRREVVRLEQELKGLDEELENLSVGLVSAEKLPQILYDMLGATQGLRFKGVETLTPYNLQLMAAQTGSEDEETLTAEISSEPAVGVFKHSVIIEIEGSYFNVVKYIQELEKLPWRFYWESIDYQVENYPTAKAVIEVYTLSTERGALGA